MAALPSDDQIKLAVHQMLKQSDLNKTTLRVMISAIADQFQMSAEALLPKRPYIRDIARTYLSEQYSQEEEPISTPTKTTSSSKATKRKSNNTNANKPVKLTGLERAVVLAEPLAQFLGEVVIARSQIAKRITTYAKENGLQDPTDGRRILCDKSLKDALSVDSFTFFSVAKLIAALVYKPEECSEELQDLAKKCDEEILAEKIKKKELEQANGVTETPSTAKRQKTKQASDKPRKPSALLKKMKLSEKLQAVCGGETTLSRPEVLKKIWEYIHANKLKDPEDGRRILCDDKLKAVTDGVESVSNMGINKYLSAHLSKIEE